MTRVWQCNRERLSVDETRSIAHCSTAVVGAVAEWRHTSPRGLTAAGSRGIDVAGPGRQMRPGVTQPTLLSALDPPAAATKGTSGQLGSVSGSEASAHPRSPQRRPTALFGVSTKSPDVSDLRETGCGPYAVPFAPRDEERTVGRHSAPPIVVVAVAAGEKRGKTHQDIN